MFSNQVHFDFQFHHRLFSFLELSHVDAEVRQVLLQVSIFNLKTNILAKILIILLCHQSD